MEEDTLVGDDLKLFFERLQIVSMADFRSIAHPEDKVAEPEIVQHEIPQIMPEPWRGFLDKRGTDCPCPFGEFRVAALQEDWYVFMLFPDQLGEGNSRFPILDTSTLEVDIGDDPQYEILVLLVVLQCFFKRRTEENLRAGPHM